jgi:hypothetical protein
MNSNSNLISRLNDALERGAEILLIKVDSKSYVRANLEVLKYFTSIAEGGIYIALNKPYFSLKKNLTKGGVDVSKLIFIDCLTRQLGGEEVDRDRCIYLNSPDPVLLQVSIERAMDLVSSENRFIYLDSLSTISLYKSFETLIKFLRHITGKIRLRGFVGTIFTIEKEMDESYFSQISLMCDEIIEVNDYV